MIRITDLTKRFEETVAVDHITLSVYPGEILGFLGPNGAGKSTTVKMLTGMLQPTSGTAEIAGFDVQRFPIEVKKRIGYIPESGAMYENLSPAEYLDFVASLYHIDPVVAESRYCELLDLFGILHAKDQRLAEFSKGMKQKVLISSALLHRPEVLFLDEPLNGLDANAAMVVKELLKKLAAQGKTIFFSSHILEVVERICTRIIIIDRGQQIIAGTARSIVEDTDSASLEDAFSRITGVRDTEELTSEFMAALERV
ncbi:MAG: ABC transporter ATP-binding protein [Bacteroidota bacterium]|jgi:ABC-2 type transport system ATP-binding protein|nr:ABC transporter ATP-binding protein [Bacteroidota bacterium]